MLYKLVLGPTPILHTPISWLRRHCDHAGSVINTHCDQYSRFCDLVYRLSKNKMKKKKLKEDDDGKRGAAPNLVEPPATAEAPSSVEPAGRKESVPGVAEVRPEWQRLKALTLVLTGPMKGQPYRSGDFVEGLRKVLGSLGEVRAFGPLNKNFEWHLTVRSDDAMQRLLAAGAITVKETCIFTVRALTTTVTRVRVHWAPFYLPMGVIAQQLEAHGEVVSASWDKGDKAEGFGEVATGVRTFIMKGVKRADLPHLLTVPLSNERGGDVAELLVTVAGRKPLCLRCRRVGHIRRACTTPYCRRHGVYGHSTEECDGTVASYSRAARPRTEPKVVEEAPAGTIPGEEEETAAEVDTPATVSVQATAGVTSAVQPAFVPLCAATAVGLNNDWPPLTAASDPPAGNVRPGNVRPDNGDPTSDNQEDWSALCAAAYRSLSESSDNEGEWTTEGRHSRRRKRRKSRSPQAGSRFELLKEVDSDAPAEGRAMC